jgi:hypothetical protein
MLRLAVQPPPPVALIFAFAVVSPGRKCFSSLSLSQCTPSLLLSHDQLFLYYSIRKSFVTENFLAPSSRPSLPGRKSDELAAQEYHPEIGSKVGLPPPPRVP